MKDIQHWRSIIAQVKRTNSSANIGRSMPTGRYESRISCNSRLITETIGLVLVLQPELIGSLTTHAD